jgi:hypothetical protein
MWMRMLVVVVSVGLASPSAAVTLNTLSDGRYILANVPTPPGCGDGGAPCTSFSSVYQYPSSLGYWSADLEGAHQQTDIGPLSMGGYGWADTTPLGYHQISAFDVTFQLDELAQYSFTGTVQVGPSGTSEAFARLCVGGCSGGEITFDRAGLFGTGSSVTFSYEGLLQPGTYQLNLGAAAYDYARFDFAFSVAPIPEPGLASLGLLALVPLARRLRR